MLHMQNDYVTGAHPLVLDALVATNTTPASGYGTDQWNVRVRDHVRREFDLPEADTFCLVGGTQVNQVSIDLLTRPWQGVLCADTAHIATHEAGAIEHSGHKVLTILGHDGLLDADEVRAWLERFYADPSHAHMVEPGMVHISYPSEYGTLYSRAQLEALRAVCDEYHLPLVADGARLAYGFTSPEADLTPADFAALVDAFTIGGTKAGALCGEVLVLTRQSMPEHAVPLIKQRGALLAKGRLLSVQFDALLDDGLYWQIGRHANECAQRLREGLAVLGVYCAVPSPTNQIFPVFTRAVAEVVAAQVEMAEWEPAGEDSVVMRVATTWSTTPDDVEQFLTCVADALGQGSGATLRHDDVRAPRTQQVTSANPSERQA